MLESQLDKIFGLGAHADSAERPGPVARDDLNGSPGWRCGPYRVLLKHYDLGEIESIRWDKLSATKQAVARQEFPEDPQLALDFGRLDTAVGPGAEVTTLVLAHSASEEPLQTELFLGRARFNADAGSPWWWRIALTRESLGVDPRASRTGRAEPLWNDTDLDIPLRPRAKAKTAATGGEHEKAQ